MSEREVVFLSGVRTAIGDYGGSLKDIPPTDLAARVVREALARAKRGSRRHRPVRIRQRDPHRGEGHVPVARRRRQRRAAGHETAR